MACEYCDGGYVDLKPTEESARLINVSIFNSDTMEPALSIGSIFMRRAFYLINYCPMCGEKLGGDA